MARRETTVRLDAELLAAVEEAAARTNQSADDVIEDALRGRFAADAALREVWSRRADSGLTEDESLALAYSELRDLRAERHRKAAS